MTESHPPSPPKLVRERLDALVLARGLAPSRERARGLIMAGKVRVAGQIADKPGMKTPANALIELVAPDPEARFVSRGGLKLEGALDAFRLNPAGLVALDIGSSTGGFTDILLQRGAPQVFAIDVGTGQLAWQLREDPRVVVMERTNIRAVQELANGARGDCAVIDVSFISLRLVLPAVARLLKPGAWIVALVKPQFEAGKREADRGGGVIRDPAVHRSVIHDLLDWLATTMPDLAPQGLIASPITGREGNHEYLLWLSYQADGPQAIAIDAVVTGPTPSADGDGN